MTEIANLELYKNMVWDIKNILDNQSIIYHTLRRFGDQWMMNLICLEEGKGYIISENEKVKRNMEKLMKNKFQENLMILPEAWLRKEIIKRSFEVNLPF